MSTAYPLTGEEEERFRAAYEEHLAENQLEHTDEALLEFAEGYAADELADQHGVEDRVDLFVLADALAESYPPPAPESQRGSRGRIFKVFNPAKVKRRLM